MHARIYQFSFIVLTSASKSGCLTPPYDKQQMILHGHCGNCISEEEVHIYTFLIKINHSMFFSVPTAKRFCGVFFVCLLFLVFCKSLTPFKVKTVIFYMEQTDFPARR